MRGMKIPLFLIMKSVYYFLYILALAGTLACNRNKDNEVSYVTSNLEKKAYIPKTASNEKQYTKVLSPEELDSIKEAKRPKTTVLDTKTMLWGTNYWAHIKLLPDGTVTGNALFFLENWHDEERELVGSWRTGTVSRGNSSIKYYEIDVNEQEWYVTEKFDYIWRGNTSYTEMRNNNIDKAGIIVKKYEE